MAARPRSESRNSGFERMKVMSLFGGANRKSSAPRGSGSAATASSAMASQQASEHTSRRSSAGNDQTQQSAELPPVSRPDMSHIGHEPISHNPHGAPLEELGKSSQPEGEAPSMSGLPFHKVEVLGEEDRTVTVVNSTNPESKKESTNWELLPKPPLESPRSSRPSSFSHDLPMGIPPGFPPVPPSSASAATTDGPAPASYTQDLHSPPLDASMYAAPSPFTDLNQSSQPAPATAPLVQQVANPDLLRQQNADLLTAPHMATISAGAPPIPPAIIGTPNADHPHSQHYNSPHYNGPLTAQHWPLSEDHMPSGEIGETNAFNIPASRIPTRQAVTPATCQPSLTPTPTAAPSLIPTTALSPALPPPDVQRPAGSVLGQFADGPSTGRLSMSYFEALRVLEDENSGLKSTLTDLREEIRVLKNSLFYKEQALTQFTGVLEETVLPERHQVSPEVRAEEMSNKAYEAQRRLELLQEDYRTLQRVQEFKTAAVEELGEKVRDMESAVTAEQHLSENLKAMLHRAEEQLQAAKLENAMLAKTQERLDSTMINMEAEAEERDRVSEWLSERRFLQSELKRFKEQAEPL